MAGIMIQAQETRLQRGAVFLSFMIMLLQIREMVPKQQDIITINYIQVCPQT